MTISQGSRLGVYEILGPLGVGGMGEVYRARDTKLGREVALKVLPDAVANNPERLTRFEREARALAALNHPGVVTIYSVEQSGRTHYLAMELVEGEGLDVAMASGGFPLDRFFEVAVPLGRRSVGGARARDRAPGPETLQCHVDPGGTRQGPRLRPGEARGFDLRRQRLRNADRQQHGADGRGQGVRHGRLHVPRAGARREGRRSLRCLLSRRRPVPDAHGRPAVSRRFERGHDLLDPSRPALAGHRDPPGSSASPARGSSAAAWRRSPATATRHPATSTTS